MEKVRKFKKTAAIERFEIKGKTYLTKLRIDKRTVITVRTQESLTDWKSKFPQAFEVN